MGKENFLYEHITMFLDKDKSTKLILYYSSKNKDFVSNVHLLYLQKDEEQIMPIIDDLKGFERDVTLYSSFKEKLITSKITTLYGELKDVQLPFDETGDNITYKLNQMVKIANEKTGESWARKKIM